MRAKEDRQDIESPESQIESYEGLNEVQKKITGEKLPDIILEICDGCNWSATCMNRRGIQATCPMCGRPASKIPMSLDEICFFEKDQTRGVTLHFDRKLPLR